MYNDVEKQKPNVFDAKTVGLALAIHIVLFLALFLVGKFTTTPKETVIPIDLTVVVHENLNGNEDEPPPEKEVVAPKPAPEPKPEPPAPKPAPIPEPEPKIDAVEKISKPKKEPPKKVEPKPEKPPKPKKTKEQLAKEREARLKAIRDSVKQGDPPKNNGRTEKRPTNWQQLLNQGYRPGAKTQLAANESQRCNSLIRNAFYAKWDSPPWTDTLGEMFLEVQFGPGGTVRGYRLVKGSGDTTADNTVLAAAARVKSIPGLSRDFLDQNPTVTVRFKVKPN